MRPKRLDNDTKKAEVLPLLGIGYDDIIGIVCCPRFIPELLFREAINGFVCKIVSLLFAYRVDVSSVTNVCTVLFPKRIVLIRGRPLFL